MTESDKSNDDSRSGGTLFQIMDRIIYELNKTKKLFIVLIIATVVAIPLSFHVTSALLEPPFHFGTARIIPILVAIAFILVGIRQWLALSRWTKKYGQYKELQKKIDAKLDYDKDER